MDWSAFLQPFLLPVVGAAAGYAFYERRRAKEASERQLKLVIALRAELHNARTQQNAMFGEDRIASVRERLISNVKKAEANGHHSMPSGAVIRANPIFDHIKPELSELPEDVIAQIIAYYQHAEAVAETLAAMYEGRYETLSYDRKVDAIEGFLAQGRKTAIAANDAFDVVDAYLNNRGKPFLRKADAATGALPTDNPSGSNDDDGRT